MNVDIENVTDVDKESYTDLVRLLREKLPKDKSVVVSVAANPYNWTTGWHGSYDYASLAKYADYLMIMTYDEHYESGTSGAVAGIEFVEKSIQYALERVDRSKIVLGIPLYGRYWKTGSSYGGYAVSIEQVGELVQGYHGEVSFDNVSKSPKATITVKSSDTKPKIYGKTLDAGTYVIWYENEESITKKLELINKYNLKGAGTWRLGLEKEKIWDVFKSHLKQKNKIFEDVEDDYWAVTAIKHLKENGIITGRTENLFMPETAITRAEIASMICRVIDINGFKEQTNEYIDVSGHWAESAINAITKMGIVNGYENKTFRPDQKITREECAKIMCSLTKEKNKLQEYIPFSDVNKTNWSYEYIKELTQKGILKGYTDNTFRGKNNITRAEVAKMIYECIR